MYEYQRPGMFNLRMSYHSNYYQPPVDVLESKHGFRIRVEIAGVDEKDFNIKFEQDTLTISGIRKDPYKNNSFHQMEIHFGEFLAEILLLQPVDSNSIIAEYKNGFLDITISKAIPQEIQIKDKDA
jgi:HSP20 family protein